MPQVTTHADLPFDELSPSAFETLVLHLLTRLTDEFETVQHVGATGQDSGADIIAKTRPDGRNVVVQVKRTHRLTTSHIKHELAKVQQLPHHLRPYHYILVTSATPSAATVFAFHEECGRVGITKHDLWNRSVLTARTLPHPDLIEYFFGINFYEQFTSRRDPSQQALDHLCQEALRRGVILVLGRSGDLAPDYPSMMEVDTMIESVLASDEGRLAVGKEHLQMASPGPAEFLKGKIDKDTYYGARSRLYQHLDQSVRFRELLLDMLAAGFSSRVPNVVRTLSELLSRNVIRGVVQLLPQPSLARLVALNPKSTINVYRGNQPVSQTPFVFDLGFEDSGLPRLALDGFDLARTLLSALPASDDGPIVVASNLSNIDLATITRLGTALPARTPFFILGSTSPIIEDRAIRVQAQLPRFLALLNEHSTSVKLSSYCQRLDFEGSPSFERIIQSAKLGPEDIALAKPPLSLADDVQTLLQTGDGFFSAASGSGKSTRAFFIARELKQLGYEVYYLSCEELLETQPLTDDLIALVTELSVKQPKCLLLVDDFHLIEKHCQTFESWVRDTRFRSRIPIIIIRTASYTAIELIGGRVVHFQPPDDSQENELTNWQREHEELFEWLTQRRDELAGIGIYLTTEHLERLRTAKNMWHFFYLLRGGAEKLTEELKQASSFARANIVWFVVCLRYYFLAYKACSVDDVVDTIRTSKLSPVEIGSDNIGPWVAECLHYLVSNRLLVPVKGGVTPRHGLEAAAVIRLGLSRAEPHDQKRFRSATLRVVKKRLPPLRLRQNTRESLLAGDKGDVHQAVYQYLNPIVERMVNFQFALVRWPELEKYFQDVWAEFRDVIQTADLHHLYWIFTRIPFSGGSLMVPPWVNLNSMKAFTRMYDVNDAIDFSYVVNGMVGRDAIKVAEVEYGYKRMLSEIQTLAVEGDNLPVFLVSSIGYKLLSKMGASSELDSIEVIRDFDQLLDSITGSDDEEETEETIDGPPETDDDKAIEDTLQSLTRLATRYNISLTDEFASLSQEFLLRQKDAPPDSGLISAKDIAHFVNTLKRAQDQIAPAFNNIPAKAMIRNIDRVGYSAGVLAFAHLWLASPAKANDVLAAMPTKMVDYLENKLINGDSFSDFHIARDTVIFQLFVRWLGERNERIAHYYQDKFLTDEIGKSVEEDITNAWPYLDKGLSLSYKPLLED